MKTTKFTFTKGTDIKYISPFSSVTANTPKNPNISITNRHIFIQYFNSTTKAFKYNKQLLLRVVKAFRLDTTNIVIKAIEKDLHNTVKDMLDIVDINNKDCPDILGTMVIESQTKYLKNYLKRGFIPNAWFFENCGIMQDLKSLELGLKYSEIDIKDALNLAMPYAAEHGLLYFLQECIKKYPQHITQDTYNETYKVSKELGWVSQTEYLEGVIKKAGYNIC